MVVIGYDKRGNYIAVVEHSEVKKLSEKYYGNMKRLQIGDDFDLGTGHDFRDDIQQACKGILDSVDGFNKVQKSLVSFASMVADLPKVAT